MEKDRVRYVFPWQTIRTSNLKLRIGLSDALKYNGAVWQYKRTGVWPDVQIALTLLEEPPPVHVYRAVEVNWNLTRKSGKKK